MVNVEFMVSEWLSESWMELSDCLRMINVWKLWLEYKWKCKMNGECIVNVRWIICLENFEWYLLIIIEIRIYIDIFSIVKLNILCKNIYFLFNVLKCGLIFK